MIWFCLHFETFPVTMIVNFLWTVLYSDFLNDSGAEMELIEQEKAYDKLVYTPSKFHIIPKNVI